MTFQIGQRVLSLHNWTKTGARFRIAVPQKHCIYTVRAFCSNAPGPAILLEEIVNTKIVCFKTLLRGEPSFSAQLFRPLFDLSQLLEIKEELENV